ncbi:MAG TPA: hypothetical protein DCE42_07190 [Myxococcales bacterium]|nr:hypothetical protein [Deltaproteobacteria bacterium]MBU51022.1 hypothetical protein [Deltaproteobacteria bacterium]HAA54524.1 hypothetical protein [Myxococcales bacterium]
MDTESSPSLQEERDRALREQGRLAHLLREAELVATQSQEREQGLTQKLQSARHEILFGRLMTGALLACVLLQFWQQASHTSTQPTPTIHQTAAPRPLQPAPVVRKKQAPPHKRTNIPPVSPAKRLRPLSRAGTQPTRRGTQCPQGLRFLCYRRCLKRTPQKRCLRRAENRICRCVRLRQRYTFTLASGPTHVKGKLTAIEKQTLTSGIQALIRNTLPRLKTCIKLAKKAWPRPKQGHMIIRWFIDATGNPSAVRMIENQTSSRVLRSCVEQKFRTIRYPTHSHDMQLVMQTLQLRKRARPQAKRTRQKRITCPPGTRKLCSRRCLHRTLQGTCTKYFRQKRCRCVAHVPK